MAGIEKQILKENETIAAKLTDLPEIVSGGNDDDFEDYDSEVEEDSDRIHADENRKSSFNENG